MASLTTAINYMDPTIYGSKQAILLGMQGKFSGFDEEENEIKPSGSGRNKGKLGAIIAEGEDNGRFFKLNIGSGFTDSQRQNFWNNKEKLIGQIVEVRADSVSKSQEGDSWSLRFPRFKTFRGFDKTEKI